MATKIEILQELERRGKLPSDKQLILNEVRQRGIVPELKPAIMEAPVVSPDIEAQRREAAGLVPIEQEQFAIESPNIFAALQALRETGQTIGRAVGAIPESGAKMAEALTFPIRHPIETAKGFKELAKGVVAKARPGFQPEEKIIDAIAEDYKKAYGSFEGFRKTVEEDPFRVALDVASIAGIGGGALRQTGKLGKLSALEKTGQAIQKAGRIAEPINLVKTPFKLVTKITPENAIHKLFESGAKVATKIPEAKKAKMVQTALDEGIVLSRSGIRKGKQIIRQGLDKVDDIIDEGVATGRGKDVVIKTEDLISSLDDVKDYFYSHPLGADFADEIDRFANTLRKNPKIGESMNLRQAQDTKKLIGKMLDEKHIGKMEKVGKAAEDAIRRGVKEKLESVFPEIGPLNRRSSDMIALIDEIEGAVGRIRNRDIFGLGSKVFAAGGMEGPAKLFSTLSETIIGDPKVKSRLAIILNKVKKAPIEGEPKTFLGKLAVPSRVIGAQTGRVMEQQENRNRLVESLRKPEKVFP